MIYDIATAYSDGAESLKIKRTKRGDFINAE